MKHTVLVIPANRDTPMKYVEYDEDTGDLAKLVFEEHPGSGMLGFSSLASEGVQFCYDDLGLYREDAEQHVNTRAMILWASLKGRPVKELNPLVGTFVALGVNQYSGETQALPPQVEVFYEMVNQYG